MVHDNCGRFKRAQPMEHDPFGPTTVRHFKDERADVDHNERDDGGRVVEAPIAAGREKIQARPVIVRTARAATRQPRYIAPGRQARPSTARDDTTARNRRI